MIAVIHNPHAKQNRKHPKRVHALREIIEGHGTLYETQSLEAVSDVARRCLKKRTGVVGVNGGDGSLQLAITLFAEVYGETPLPSFVVMRGGTMNTVANGLGIKGTPETILKKVIEGLEGRKPLTRMRNQVLDANGQIGFMSGAAVVVKFLDAYYDAPTQGPVQAIKMGCQLAGSAISGGPHAREMFAPVPLEVTVDGRKLEQPDYRILLGCTVEDISMGCRATPRAYERKGAFHFLACSLSPMQIVTQIPKLWMGKDLTHPEVHFSEPVECVTIRNPEGGPVRWMLDGERLEDDEVTLKVWGEVELVW